jgi:hypothetical protein
LFGRHVAHLFLQALHAALAHRFAQRPHARQAAQIGETLRAFTGEQAVRCAGDVTRQQHRVAHVAHTGDGAQSSTRVHHRGVHFNGDAIGCKGGAGAGIEAAIVFQGDHGLHDRIERLAVCLQHPQRRIRRGMAAVYITGRGAGATVHDNRTPPAHGRLRTQRKTNGAATGGAGRYNIMVTSRINSLYADPEVLKIKS